MTYTIVLKSNKGDYILYLPFLRIVTPFTKHVCATVILLLMNIPHTAVLRSGYKNAILSPVIRPIESAWPTRNPPPFKKCHTFPVGMLRQNQHTRFKTQSLSYSLLGPSMYPFVKTQYITSPFT